MTKNLFAIIFLLVSASTQAMDQDGKRSPKYEERTPSQEAQRAAGSNRRKRSQSLTAEKTELPNCSNDEDEDVFSNDEDEDVFSNDEQDKITPQKPAAVLAKKSTSHSKLRVFSPVPLTSQPRKSIELVSLRKIMEKK